MATGAIRKFNGILLTLYLADANDMEQGCKLPGKKSSHLRSACMHVDLLRM